MSLKKFKRLYLRGKEDNFKKFEEIINALKDKQSNNWNPYIDFYGKEKRYMFKSNNVEENSTTCYVEIEYNYAKEFRTNDDLIICSKLLNIFFSPSIDVENELQLEKVNEKYILKCAKEFIIPNALKCDLECEIADCFYEE